MIETVSVESLSTTAFDDFGAYGAENLRKGLAELGVPAAVLERFDATPMPPEPEPLQVHTLDRRLHYGVDGPMEALEWEHEQRRERRRSAFMEWWECVTKGIIIDDSAEWRSVEFTLPLLYLDVDKRYAQDIELAWVESVEASGGFKLEIAGSSLGATATASVEKSVALKSNGGRTLVRLLIPGRVREIRTYQHGRLLKTSEQSEASGADTWGAEAVTPDGSFSPPSWGEPIMHGNSGADGELTIGDKRAFKFVGEATLGLGIGEATKAGLSCSAATEQTMKYETVLPSGRFTFEWTQAPPGLRVGVRL